MSSNSRPCSLLTTLPVELHHELLRLLDDYTATQLSMVCRSVFYGIASDANYWQSRYRASFPMRPEEEELDRWMNERKREETLFNNRQSLQSVKSLSHYSIDTTNASETCSPFYWYFYLKRRAFLQEKWRRGHYRIQQIPLPIWSSSSSNNEEFSVSVVATSPWRTLVIYRPIPLDISTSIGNATNGNSNDDSTIVKQPASSTRLVAVEHATSRRRTSTYLTASSSSSYLLQNYAAVQSTKSPYVLMSRNYTVAYNLYHFGYAYTWVWRRDNGRPLTIPSLRNRCCRPQTLIDHWLLVLVTFESCKPTDTVPIYLINLSHYTSNDDNDGDGDGDGDKYINEDDSVIPINILGGCVTCHVQSTDASSWRIFTGMHRQDRFHWQLWQVSLPNGKTDTTPHQDRTQLVASGCIPEPEPLSAFSNAVTYMDTWHSVIVDWRPEFNTTCQYSHYDLTGETPPTNLWLTDRQYSLDWHHCRAPARRTLSSNLYIDQRAGQVRMNTAKGSPLLNSGRQQHRPNAYLCRVASTLRIAGSTEHGWYLVEEPDQHGSNNCHHHHHRATGNVLGIQEQGSQYRILWPLPITPTNRVHHHACATHLCAVQGRSPLITRDNSDGVYAGYNEPLMLTILDVAGICDQHSTSNSSQQRHCLILDAFSKMMHYDRRRMLMSPTPTTTAATSRSENNFWSRLRQHVCHSFTRKHY
ncbi:hypothetical protein BDF22DRAFT_79433 [Syncephalis plumigaleata]|nr:hypothetical protein BDF22DRAFT_79433 [Syncephalis plumigaleata]